MEPIYSSGESKYPNKAPHDTIKLQTKEKESENINNYVKKVNLSPIQKIAFTEIKNLKENVNLIKKEKANVFDNLLENSLTKAIEICEGNPSQPANIALLKLHIESCENIERKSMSFWDKFIKKINFIAEKFLGVGTIGKADKLFKDSFEKLNFEGRKKAISLMALYRGFIKRELTELEESKSVKEINIIKSEIKNKENKYLSDLESLIYSCGDKSCEVENVHFFLTTTEKDKYSIDFLKKEKKLTSAIQYTGTVRYGVPDGKGTMTFENGETYIGEFKGGKKSGLGVVWTPAVERGDSHDLKRYEYEQEEKRKLIESDERRRLEPKERMKFETKAKNEGKNKEWVEKKVEESVNVLIKDKVDFWVNEQIKIDLQLKKLKPAVVQPKAYDAKFRKVNFENDKEKAVTEIGEYTGAVDEKGIPKGEGTLTITNPKIKGYKQVQNGVFANGELAEGTVIHYQDDTILRREGLIVLKNAKFYNDNNGIENLGFNEGFHKSNQIDPEFYKGSINEKGIPDGKGLLTAFDGSKYQVDYSDGILKRKTLLDKNGNPTKEVQVFNFSTPWEESYATFSGFVDENNQPIQGVLKISDSEVIYKGTFKDNKFMEGTVENLTIKDVGVYTGVFNQGKANGKGILKVKEGVIYEGEFINNRLKTGTKTSPQAIISTVNDKDRSVSMQVTGQFKSGSFNPMGELTGEGEKEVDGAIDRGNFHGGKLNGYGERYFLDKNILPQKGYFANGVFQYEVRRINNILYEAKGGGKFLEKGFEGQGLMRKLDGSTYEGNFTHGELNGIIKCTEKDQVTKYRYEGGERKEQVK